jgi:hypothetical protein
MFSELISLTGPFDALLKNTAYANIHIRILTLIITRTKLYPYEHLQKTKPADS